jgi:hypothetical protein
MPEKVLGTIRVIICRLNKVNQGSNHLFTQEAWKNIWRDFSFCVQYAEGRLYCYDTSSEELIERLAGIVRKIEIKKTKVFATIDLIDTEGGRRLYEKSKEKSLINNFCVSGEGRTEGENGYDRVVAESFKLTSVHFIEEPLVWEKPRTEVLVDAGVTVTETDISTIPVPSEWIAPAGFDRGRLVEQLATALALPVGFATGNPSTTLSEVRQGNWGLSPLDPRQSIAIPGSEAIQADSVISYPFNSGHPVEYIETRVIIDDPTPQNEIDRREAVISMNRAINNIDARTTAA